MKYIKYLLVITCCLLSSSPLVAKPKHGKGLELVCDYKKLKGNEYELIFKVNLEKGNYVKANNDYDTLQKLKMPYFVFDGNSLYTTLEEISSQGLIETKKLKHIGIVNVYSYNILYHQKVSAMPGTIISGTYHYQMCTDKSAKHVKSQKFSVIVK